MRYNKPFLRMGRSETVHVQVTNPNSVWETPFVKIQFVLANVPSDETVTITYKVLAPNGAELKAGKRESGIPPTAARSSYGRRYRPSRTDSRRAAPPSRVSLVTPIASTRLARIRWAIALRFLQSHRRSSPRESPRRCLPDCDWLLCRWSAKKRMPNGLGVAGRIDTCGGAE